MSYRIAAGAAVESLLNCWLRECGAPAHFSQATPGSLVRLPLPRLGVELTAALLYWSATGAHRWGSVTLGQDVPVDPATLAALLAREATTGPGDGIVDLVGRVADSTARVATFVEARPGRSADPAPAPAPFLEAEQSLLLGHPFHPAPKSRPGLAEAEARRYSPELRGSFPLHWFGADRRLVAEDSGLPEPASAILAGLAEPDGAAAVAGGGVLVPVHPWQARQLRLQPYVQDLLAGGLLRDLGELGPVWHATSSVRTLYRPDAAYMLKLSLALPVTNSVRRNLRKELLRGLEAHRLLQTALGDELRARFPHFDVVRDPAWLTVLPPPGQWESGFEV
ncbi:MAG TPA: IucA/IucC family protein, partial [Chloroflexota bacterium]|nr:IucA/IucC family protein [Chloroflexota bacterium]